MTLFRIGVAAATVFTASTFIASRPISAQAPGLKIVVVEGEDAVNIIQQKTAVAPIVEVRDRNDQPIAGAVVNFAIRGGRASFGGARTLSVTTNVAGRAVASGLTPTASGAVQISASAAFQGQTAAVAITQTNVMTAAQAAAVSSAAGSSGGGTAAGTSAGAAGGGGSGLSATTIGIIGGAVAGGAVAATKVLGDEGGGKTFTATYTGQILMTTITQSGGPGCSFIESLNGTVTIQLNDPNTAAGTAEVQESHTITSGNCGNIGGGATNETANGSLSGPPSALTFAVQKTNPLSNNGLRTKPWSFSGQLNGNEITGVLTTGDINAAANGVVVASGSAQIPITLR